MKLTKLQRHTAYIIMRREIAEAPYFVKFTDVMMWLDLPLLFSEWPELDKLWTNGETIFADAEGKARRLSILDKCIELTAKN